MQGLLQFRERKPLKDLDLSAFDPVGYFNGSNGNMNQRFTNSAHGTGIGATCPGATHHLSSSAQGFRGFIYHLIAHVVVEDKPPKINTTRQHKN